jgi:hypothetical protein
MIPGRLCADSLPRWHVNTCCVHATGMENSEYVTYVTLLQGRAVHTRDDLKKSFLIKNP